MLVLKRVKRAPLAVDGHFLLGVQTHLGELGDVLGSLHVRGIASRAEDTGDARLGVDVVGSDERTGRVVDKGGELGAYSKLLKRFGEERGDVFTFDACGAKALGPADKLAVVDALLRAGVGEGKTERKVVGVLVAAEGVADETVQALGAEVKPAS